MTKNNKNGFTLIELLITLVIVGILLSIAYPSYSHYLTKARRVDAQVALLDLASRMEQYYSENNHSYKDATLTKLKINKTTVNGFYSLSISKATATTFLLMAQPLGIQAIHDTQCGALTIDQLGERKGADTSSGATCWS